MSRKAVRWRAGQMTLEVAIGGAILTAAIVAATFSFRNSDRSMAQLIKQQDMEAMRGFVREFLSCDSTLPFALPDECIEGLPIDLKGADDTVLIPSTGRKVGPDGVMIKATCNADRQIEVMANVNPKGKAEWKSVFNGIPLRCTASGGAGPVVDGCNHVYQLFKKKQKSKKSPTVYSTYAAWDAANPAPKKKKKLPDFLEKKGGGSYCSPDGKTKSKSKGKLFTTIKDDQKLCGMPGVDFRNDGSNRDGDYYIAVGFSARPDKVKFAPEYIEWDNLGGALFTNIPSVSLVGPKYYQGQRNASGETVESFHFPYKDFIEKNNWYNNLGIHSEARFTITPQKANGTDDGEACYFRIALMSPLVLDFTGQQELDPDRLIALPESTTQFDLDGNGSKEPVGWLTPSLSLLALDLNGDGAITSGRELFGDATRLPGGKRAVNGYEALAQYDLAKRGYIDSSDPIFDSLLVWTDENLDGVSQPSEIKRLSQTGVSRVQTAYESATMITSADPLANRARFQARFWGPKSCGKLGCRSYDVYFTTSESRRVAHR